MKFSGDTDPARVLKHYPKVRTPLPLSFQELYATHYKSNRDGASPASGLAQKMEAWMHVQVAKDLPQLANPPRTLEIGAGTLNHLPYETFAQYDIVEPFTELYAHSPFLPKITNNFTSIYDISSTEKYDRIISIATFEHVLDLPQLTAKAANLLTEKGTLRIAIPAEGSWLWKLGWKLTTGLEFKIKHNLDYAILMKHEHVNTYEEISTILLYLFETVQPKYFGLGRTSSFYHFYECTQPRTERVNEILSE